MTANHDLYIRHCFNLAKRSGKDVNVNPHVGAVIVSQGRIIGTGWHQKYGEAHAEINAFLSVSHKDRQFIKGADLYVSLEPCHSIGKTGPCSKAIIEHGIKRVFVSALDPTIQGKSLRFLESQGIEVQSGYLEDLGNKLIEPFQIQQEKKRPFVILKYAQSKDYFIGKKDLQYWISNEYSKLQVHKWRSEVDGILIGVNTLLIDDPQLNTRLYPGDSPRPIIIDPKLRSDTRNRLFNLAKKPIVFTAIADSKKVNAEIIQIDFDNDPLDQILTVLHSEYNIARLLVEGGAKTLKCFIEAKLWDEARVITGSQFFKEGIKAPNLSGHLINSYHLDEDFVRIIRPEALLS